MQQSRRLVLVRHAEAAHGASDVGRPLTAGGERAAAALGAELGRMGLDPDHALVSAALRAQQTWEALAGAAAWTVDPEVSQPWYAAETESGLDLLREVPEGATVVVAVGHNPTVASLAQLLDDGHGDDEAVTGLLRGGFPPGTALVLEHDGGWADLGPATARPTHYLPPR